MNIPPETDLRVPAEQLADFCTRLGQAAGMPADQAALLAELLTGNDLRGVVSHGTQQLATYARLLRERRLNPAPAPAVVRQSPVSLLVDGDGGLGYFAATEATRRLVDLATEQGMAVAVTRNHGHIGAAGLYARMTLGHDLLCFVTSGHQLALAPGRAVFEAAGGSPMAFTAPTGEEPPLVLDFGAMHDLYADSPHRERITELAPGLVHRCIGLGTVCQAWGGLLAGVPVDGDRADRRWPGATQGAMVVLVRIDLFLPAEQFRAEMDAYARAVAALEPLSPGGRASLAGGPEAARERENRVRGVPVGEEQRRLLSDVGQEFGVPLPWA